MFAHTTQNTRRIFTVPCSGVLPRRHRQHPHRALATESFALPLAHKMKDRSRGNPAAPSLFAHAPAGSAGGRPRAHRVQLPAASTAARIAAVALLGVVAVGYGSLTRANAGFSAPRCNSPLCALYYAHVVLTSSSDEALLLIRP